VILAAGGTNFPVDPPWKQGKKVWYDAIWAFDGKSWREVGKLDRPLAMGASLTTPRGVLFAGGGDDDEVVADAFLLRYEGGRVVRENLPPLPKPLMATAAAVVAGRAYVVGGHSELSAMTQGPLAEVYSLDLRAPSSGWRTEPPIPAEGRYLPVVGSDGRHLYVFSGMTRVMDAEGKPQIHCLSDAWRYTPPSSPGQPGQWQRLPDLPRANAAGPSPAPFVNGRLILLGGGVDDTNFGGPMENRPPFPPLVTAVDVRTGEAKVIGEVRSSVLVAPVVPWKGGYVVASGEIRPGVRTPAVWSYHFDREDD
jgi:N-acetylneuraminic acid mutarotase